ncbi:hypothetical protein FE257_002142 [Aspergillus nanangensis]|uniref:Uncharacterized protein n=1 Tax=Aspergillus nanangensis TaxID=2582783 RepID=A0AAD4CTE4_ASPNN|nr:hypothetical protein FE257_002142 [Aspergillus nanangensis]
MDRPSFQSPTKASLARSHPEILQRAISRSPTRSPRKPGQRGQQDESEARVFGLRDRKALRPSLTLTGSPISLSKKAPMSPISFAKRRTSLQAFAAPPRRVSRRIVPSDLMFQSPSRQKKALDAAVTNTPEDQLVSELGDATGDGDFQGNLEQASSPEFEEPDLPPTPTQLGLEKPPGRPTGISSSSPTAKHTKLGRRQIDILQSPSKLRTVDYGGDVDGRSEFGIGMDGALFPEPVLKKQKLKNRLSAQIHELKDEILELESWSGSVSQDGEPTGRDLNKLITLLASQDSIYPSTQPHKANTPMSSLISTLLPFASKISPNPPQEPLPKNPFSLDQSSQTKPYLATFTPLNLVSRSSTSFSQEMGIVVERHNLTVSAPSPFPSKLFNISVTYDINPETQSVTSVKVPTLISGPELPECLRQWITSRLANPLMKLDISGLCWGINRYWEVTISRARIWSQIEDRQAGLIAGSYNFVTPARGQQSKKSNQDILTKTDLRRILPHLERTSMLFESKEKGLSMLLSCEISIDEWTSEPRLVPGISLSMLCGLNSVSGKRIEQEAKRLFYAVLSENGCSGTKPADDVSADTVLEATECVLGILLGTDTEDRLPKE